MTVQGVLIDAYGVAFAVNATAFTPTVTQSDISSKACFPLTFQVSFLCISAWHPLLESLIVIIPDDGILGVYVRRSMERERHRAGLRTALRCARTPRTSCAPSATSAGRAWSACPPASWASWLRVCLLLCKLPLQSMQG